MFYIIWKYEVSDGKREAFEKEYNRGGSWFKFFEPCSEYLGHELLKEDGASNYLLIDKWMSKADYTNFLTTNKAEYEVLNARSKELYDEENKVGEYTVT